MTTQTVTFCTTSCINCGNGYSDAILCVPIARTSNASGFIIATFSGAGAKGNCCQSVNCYTFIYDDTQLNDASTPLTQAEVNSAFCKDCYTLYIESVNQKFIPLYVNSTPIVNTVTSQQVLMTYILPANTLAIDNQRLEVHILARTIDPIAAGSFQFYFGGSLVLGTNVFTSEGWLDMRLTIVRTGSATQRIGAQEVLTSASPGIFATSNQITTKDLTLPQILEVRGTSTINGTIEADLMTVDKILEP